MKHLYRKLRLISLLAQAGYWIDRLWQQLQSHRLYLMQSNVDA